MQGWSVIAIAIIGQFIIEDRRQVKHFLQLLLMALYPELPAQMVLPESVRTGKGHAEHCDGSC